MVKQTFWSAAGLFIATLLLLLAGCGDAGVAPGSGAAGDTMRISLNISQWLASGTPYRALVINQSGSSYSASLERSSGAPVELGSLQRQFPGSPISTVLFEIGDQRFIAGIVDPDAAGSEMLDSIDFERVEPNRARWMDALKASTIKRGSFLIPIRPEEREQWASVQRIAIKTRESLQRGVQDSSASGTISNQIFATPIDIGDLFKTVP